MAIETFTKWKETEKSSDDRTKEAAHIFENPAFDNETLGVQKLYDKVEETATAINSNITSIAANTAKTGITSSQASAITANTAKVSLVGGSATAISFGEMITTVTGKKPNTTTAYTIVMTVTKDSVSKSVTLTLA